MNGQTRRALVAALAALLVAACDNSGSDSDRGPGDGDWYQAPQPTLQVALTGAGAASALPLAARVEAYVEDDRTLRLRINNTTEERSSGVAGGPVLTGIGFNLAGDLPADCLDVSGPEGEPPVLTRKLGVLPACAPPGATEGLFVVELGAADAATPGVGRAQTRDVVLRLQDGCPSALAFSKEGLLSAPRARAGGKLVQWAGYLDRVGIDGADAGCVTGDGAEAPPKPVLDRVWTNFSATAAEIRPQPSLVNEADTRAASVEVRVADLVDAEGQAQPPGVPAVVVTLRDGTGRILEQWYLNERYPPETVGADDCDPTTPFPRCYLYESDGEGGAGLWVELPRAVAHSNVGFDEDGGRVTVTARAGFERSADGTVRRSVRLTWEHPEGIEEARFEVRAQTDYNLDGSFEDDPFVPLYRARWAGSGPDQLAGPVTVVRETATRTVIEIDVEEGGPYVRRVYRGEP